MIPYITGTVLTIASPGCHIAEEADAIVGKMRSRAGAKLEYTLNDIRALHKKMPTYGANVDGELAHYELIDPSLEKLITTVEKITSLLRCSRHEVGRKKSFYIIYAGHGQSSDGAWELRDGTISGANLYYTISNIYEDCKNKLHVDLILDSCYSSRFLIDFVVSSQHDKIIYPFDCIASSLPEETSWEMDFLQHGAMSFHLAHEGNYYVDSTELARAIDKRDFKVIVRALQGATVPNPITFLTNGRQHCVILTSGHHLEIQGAGNIELEGYFGSLTHAGLSNALIAAKTAYGEEVQYKD